MSKFPGDKGYQAFRILQFAFVVAPIVAGLDKFFNLLVEWAVYLSPFFMNLIHGQDQIFLGAAGIIEIIAGIGGIFKPKIFAYIISGWLGLIILMLLQTGYFYDIALRDLGLALAAFSLGKLSEKYSE
jgi:hypothetical protein